MPAALKQLQHLLTKGVKATATLWPPLQSAYEQVHQAAPILANPQQHTGTQERSRYLAHVCQMQEQKTSMEPLGEAIEHFCHITDNFAAGLFHCYDVEGLPCTNTSQAPNNRSDRREFPEPSGILCTTLLSPQ